jgi:hypothetical protein
MYRFNGEQRRNLLHDDAPSQINPAEHARRKRGLLLRLTQLAPTARREIAIPVALEASEGARSNA